MARITMMPRIRMEQSLTASLIGGPRLESGFEGGVGRRLLGSGADGLRIGQGGVRSELGDLGLDLFQGLTLLAGDFFGESALLQGAPRNASCTTVAPSLLYQLQRADLDRVCDLCPAMRKALERAAAEREQNDQGE